MRLPSEPCKAPRSTADRGAWLQRKKKPMAGEVLMNMEVGCRSILDEHFVSGFRSRPGRSLAGILDLLIDQRDIECFKHLADIADVLRLGIVRFDTCETGVAHGLGSRGVRQDGVELVC